jgi:hypothetical protein
MKNSLSSLSVSLPSFLTFSRITLLNSQILNFSILLISHQVEGSKFAYELTQTKVFRALNATLNPNVVPACEKFPRLSDEFWGCLAKHYTQTIYHPAGTTKMGPSSDPMAVVDPELRVYGIKNLRVVDCGIMPTIVTGNTNVPTIMIAEKAADMVKMAYLAPPKPNFIPKHQNYQQHHHNEIYKH